MTLYVIPANDSVLSQSGTQVSQLRHDDMLGDVATAPTGASQWATAQIGLTGFIINWLQAGQNDFFQIKLQMSHRKALSTPLDSLHVHYVLSANPSAGDTVKFSFAYTWVLDGAAIPAIASWVTTPAKTITFAGTEVANTIYRSNIVTNIAAPANETYSSMFLFKCSRLSQGEGADTYAGNFGLMYVDAHFETNRLGSVNETSD